jgi:hypothetical protein
MALINTRIKENDAVELQKVPECDLELVKVDPLPGRTPMLCFGIPVTSSFRPQHRVE